MKIRTGVILVLLLSNVTVTQAQEILTVDEAIALAIERNPGVESARLAVKQSEALKGTALDLPKTNISLLYGQFNSIHKNDNNISISQTIPFPTVFTSQRELVKSRLTFSQLEEALVANQLRTKIRQVFNRLLYLQEREKLFMRQDSIFSELKRVADIQYKTGEGTLLQLTAAESGYMEVQNALRRNNIDWEIARNQLSLLCQVEGLKEVNGELAAFLPSDIVAERVGQNSVLQIKRQQIEVAKRERRLEVARSLPDFEIGYFNQTLIGTQNVNGVDEYFSSADRFQGVQVGIAIPLFFTSPRARIKAAAYASQVAEKEYAETGLQVSQEYNAAIQAVEKNQASIIYYKDTALKHSDMLITQSQQSFRHGELDYSGLLLNVRQALTIREGYLLSLYELNDSKITLLFLTGN